MKSRRDERNEELREATRQRLITTALRLFARDGYAETSVKAIAKEAGVAQGLLYHYFVSKEALVQAIFTECMAQVQESFAAGGMETGGPPEERLTRIIRRSFEILRANLDFWKLTYVIRFQPAVLASVAPILEPSTAAIRATFSTLFTEMGEPGAPILAALLFAQIDGVSQHYALEPNTYPLETVQEAIIARFCYREGGQ
jgi:AcrR family transcriptional regulator